jgi:hypothetical protein
MSNEPEFEKQEVTIDDVTYYYEDLPETIRHILGEVSVCRSKKEELEKDIQRADMMQAGYVSALKEEMDKYLSAND